MPTNPTITEIVSPKSPGTSNQVTLNPTPKHTSYASMLDPDEGNTLEYIPVIEINGVACAQLEIEDVSEKIEY